jgi:hypothetical protein
VEMKLATATSNDISMASNQHYNLEATIRDAVSRMTLAGKRVLADKIVDYCAECEKEAK